MKKKFKEKIDQKWHYLTGRGPMQQWEMILVISTIIVTILSILSHF